MVTTTANTTDTFNVTAAWNQESYATGQTAIVTISGEDVVTQTATLETTIGPLTIPVIASDGATSDVIVAAIKALVVTTTATSESVVIDTSRPIVDSGSNPRVWQVSADKLSISAVV